MLACRGSTSKAVCLIEWAERMQSQRPEEHLAVNIDIIADSNSACSTAKGIDSSGGTSGGHHDGTAAGLLIDEEDIYSDQRSRRVTLTPHGGRWVERLQRLAIALSSMTQEEAGGMEVINYQ